MICAERLQHGCIGHIDPYLVVFGGRRRFFRHRACAVTMALEGHRWRLIQTGIPASSTRECVLAVRNQYGPCHHIWKQFSEITFSLEKALTFNQSEHIGAALKKNHQLLHQLCVVPEVVNRFIAKLALCGFAAKISGAGSVKGDKARYGFGLFE